MSNEDVLKNVPDVNSEEFKNKMKNLGFDVERFEAVYPEGVEEAFNFNFDNIPNKKKSIFSKIKNWAKENKELLVCGTFVIGSFVILCKASEIITTNSIFKANVKTIEHLANNYILVHGGFDE